MFRKVIFIFLLSVSNSSCGSNLSRYNLTGKWYFYDQSLKIQWKAAVEYCDNLGLSMLVIDTAEKLLFWSNFTLATGYDIWV